MSIEHHDYVTAEDEIEFCLKRETEERAAAMLSADVTARDSHASMAERYADRAHSLVENHPSLDHIPSGLWGDAAS